MEAGPLLIKPGSKDSLEALLPREDHLQGLKPLPVIVKHRGRVLDLVVSGDLQSLCIWEEPVDVTGVLHRRRGLVEDIASDGFVLNAHLNQLLQA